MKTRLLKGTAQDTLKVVFLGFGQDLTPFFSLKLSSDTLFVYDYEDDSADFGVIYKYEKYDVIAWSLGVMMADIWVSKTEMKPRRMIAINGTPFGVNSEKGVDSALYQATLANLSEDNMTRFYRRMCGRGQEFIAFSKVKPLRSIDSFKNELIFLAGKSATHCPGENIWDEAFIGLKDAIIAPLNQERGWRDLALNVVKLDVSHYSAQFFKEKLE